MQLQLQHGQEARLFVTQRTIIPAAEVQVICAFEEAETFAEAVLQNRLLLIKAAMRLRICLDPALHK